MKSLLLDFVSSCWTFCKPLELVLMTNESLSKLQTFNFQSITPIGTLYKLSIPYLHLKNVKLIENELPQQLKNMESAEIIFGDNINSILSYTMEIISSPPSTGDYDNYFDDTDTEDN